MVAYPQSDDLHGIYMTEEAFERLISVESPYRYELIDGVVYDMTGSTPEHSAIASNVEGLLHEQLGRSGPCRAHRDQYVAIPGKPPVVPDVVLTYDRADWDKDKRLKPFMIQSPLIVVSTAAKFVEQTWTSAVRVALIQSNIPSVPATFQEVIGYRSCPGEHVG